MLMRPESCPWLATRAVVIVHDASIDVDVEVQLSFWLQSFGLFMLEREQGLQPDRLCGANAACLRLQQYGYFVRLFA